MNSKTIRQYFVFTSVAALSSAFLLLGGCSKQAPTEAKSGDPTTQPTQTAAAKYTCPMHPEVVQDKAGDCPKCGMKLVEKR